MENLINQKQDIAKNFLTKQGILYLLLTEYSDTIEKDNVIRTEPAAGEPLYPGQSVTVYLSIGSEAGVMPNLTEMEQEAAKELLGKQNLNLNIKVEEEYSSTVEIGKVLRTKPEKGTDLKPNDEIILYVSKGPEMKNMPWLVGVNIDTAKNSLSTAGFRKAPEIRYVYNAKPEGTVISQSPEAYKQADVNTVVVLEVSKGVLLKDVTITVPASEGEETRKVEILRDGKVLWSNAEQAPEEATVTLKDQEGLGTVTYQIRINDTEITTVDVQF